DNYRASERGLTPLPADQDVVVRRISGSDPSWPVLICNGDLHSFSQFQLGHLLGVLDLDIYARMLAETYEKNWQNAGAGTNAELGTVPDAVPATVPAALSNALPNGLPDGLGEDAQPADGSIDERAPDDTRGDDPAHPGAQVGQDGLGDIA
ncbi:MAG: hypothetical protein ACRDS9_09335, partial [Pseudonocardiaceae bacterium]